MNRDELREIYRTGQKNKEAPQKSGLFFKQTLLSLLIIAGGFGLKTAAKSTDTAMAMAQTVEGELSSTKGFADLESYLDEKISSLPVFAGKNQNKEGEEQPAEKTEPTATVHTEVPEENSGTSVQSEKTPGGMTFLRAENRKSFTETTFQNYCDVFYETESTAVAAPAEENVDAAIEKAEPSAPKPKANEPFADLAVPVWAELSQHQLPTKIKTPIKGTVTSGFGYREHPTTGKIAFHPGVDIAANTGTSIQAAFTGKVEETGSDRVYGNYVILRYNQALTVFYAHMDQVNVKQGSKVKAGGKVGTVGTTGISTGSHLHFEVRLNGVKLNALYYIDP